MRCDCCYHKCDDNEISTFNPYNGDITINLCRNCKIKWDTGSFENKKYILERCEAIEDQNDVFGDYNSINARGCFKWLLAAIGFMILPSAISTVLNMNGIKLGAIPTVILYAPFFAGAYGALKIIIRNPKNTHRSKDI